MLQRELSRNAAVFGRLEAGTPEKPSVVIENVHHFYKQVAGKTLARPPWFFDPKQQGEGIVDAGLPTQPSAMNWHRIMEQRTF